MLSLVEHLFFTELFVGDIRERHSEYINSKFQSLIKDADKNRSSTTTFDDPRIAKIRNFKKNKLDELPQIGQVFLEERVIIEPTKKRTCLFRVCHGFR